MVAARTIPRLIRDVLDPGTRVAAWRITGELGRGGMARVYGVVADDGDPAAIKIIHPELLDHKLSAETFLREARIAHAVDHPGAIDIYATGTYGGRPYMVMEQLAGVSLGHQLDHTPAMPRVDAVALLLEVCSILRAAHAAGIVHRDLKPDNVFLRDTPVGGRRVKLLDWGVAHVAGEDDPFRGVIAGTLSYVAPEQIRGDALTPAADIYSLGVLAFRLLCRRPPFAGPTDVALLRMHLHHPAPRPCIAWPQIPPALDALIVAMLAKQPGSRPGLDAIERVLRSVYAQLAPVTPVTPIVDVLGRPIVQLPALRLGWLIAAIALAGIGVFVSVLASA